VLWRKDAWANVDHATALHEICWIAGVHDAEDALATIVELLVEPLSMASLRPAAEERDTLKGTIASWFLGQFNLMKYSTDYGLYSDEWVVTEAKRFLTQQMASIVRNVVESASEESDEGLPTASWRGLDEGGPIGEVS